MESKKPLKLLHYNTSVKYHLQKRKIELILNFTKATS